MAQYSSELLKKEDEGMYTEFLQKHSHYLEHTLHWREILQKNFSFTPLHLVAKNEMGEIKALLPLFEAKSVLFGKRIVSTPYSMYTEIIAEEQEAAQKLYHHARKLAVERNANYLEIRSKQEIPALEKAGFTVKKDFTNFYLDLRQGLEEIWKQFPRSLRMGIKKAVKEGLTIREDNSKSGLDILYRLFLNTRKYRGVPAYPYQMFEDIMSSFSKEAKILVVEQNGTPVVAGLFYFYNDTVRYAYVGARHEESVSSMKPYYLLLWEAIKTASRKGYATLDYGGATPATNDGGLYAFKEQWSNKRAVINSYFSLNKSKTIPDQNTFTLASTVWKKIPLPIIKAVSPLVIKQFV